MKLLPWLILIIGAGLVYVFWPEPKEPDYSLHEARIAQREQAISELQVENTKLLSRIKSDSVSHKIELQAYKDMDKKKSAYIANLKANPTIVKVRSEVPEVDSLIHTYDTLLASKDAQLHMQGKYISTLQVDIGALKNNFEERLKLQSQTISDQAEIIQNQRKELRKERKNKTLAKVVAVGAAIGGFLLGSQL